MLQGRYFNNSIILNIDEHRDIDLCFFCLTSNQRWCHGTIRYHFIFHRMFTFDKLQFNIWSASTDSLNDFVLRREFVFRRCFCYTQVSDRCKLRFLAAPQRYCRTWSMNQCCMFLTLITFMNRHCFGAQNTVICDHLIPCVIDFEVEVLHTKLFLQYLNAPSSSSSWLWSEWVRWITLLMSSTIGRTAGGRSGKFTPLSIPLHHLWTWTSHLISRLWLAQPYPATYETGWSNQGKPSNHGKYSLGTLWPLWLLHKIKHVILCLIIYMWYLH